MFFSGYLIWFWFCIFLHSKFHRFCHDEDRMRNLLTPLLQVIKEKIFLLSTITFINKVRLHQTSRIRDFFFEIFYYRYFFFRFFLLSRFFTFEIFSFEIIWHYRWRKSSESYNLSNTKKSFCIGRKKMIIFHWEKSSVLRRKGTNDTSWA